MSRGLRVLMTADTVGGVWTYACELVAALRPLGVEVTLATMGAPLSPAQARTAAAAPHTEVFESSFALEWMPDPWRDVDAAGDWLLALAQLTRPDVVHINGYAHAALPFGVPVVSVAHSCVCSWFRAVRHADAGPEWDEYRARARRGLRAASAVIAPTRAILAAILGALESDVRGRVILNGRSCEPHPVPKESFVLSAGRLWDEAKGLADLDACARMVHWPIRVAGSTVGPAGAEVTAAGVELLGELDPTTLASWMSRAAIYALPARYEPFGLSILEAAQAGCALVLGEIDSLREIWGTAALYVRPGDRDALAFTLNTLARDPLRCGVLSSAAKTRARALTPLRMATGYQALYQELTGGLDRRVVHA
ncbi:MAG: glycosyl transferase family 1 [Myxococcales bacterium]|nr:glycosyl transferase family 1 [Myxococcales bacterium]